MNPRLTQRPHDVAERRWYRNLETTGPGGYYFWDSIAKPLATPGVVTANDLLSGQWCYGPFATEAEASEALLRWEYIVQRCDDYSIHSSFLTPHAHFAYTEVHG